MPWSPMIRIIAILVLLAALPAAAGEDLSDDGANHFARHAGLRALKAGKPEEAAKHFVRALRDHPHATLLLEDLVLATQNDPDVQTFWLHRYVATIADEKGRFRPSKRTQAFLPKKNKLVRTVASERAKAAKDLAKRATKLKGPGAYTQVRAYRRLFDTTVDAAPTLRARYAPDFDKALAKARPTTGAILKAIEKGTGASGSPEHRVLRLELGRALIGMATQARQKAKGSEKVDAPSLLRLGSTLVDSAQAALAAQQMEPLTVEQLEAMKPSEIDAFNLAHTRIETPGRALSPEGRYEIRTACGHGTLLAAASMADGIHGRLARWFGADPFPGKPGLILIYPEWDDMEAENTPYWWANGFQRGSVTTIHFAHSNAMEMASLLTHELTHRFDRVYYPAGVGWLKEGRATWTQTAFNGLWDEKLLAFAPNVAHFKDVRAAYAQGYFLTQLLRGTPRDYRDNYPAGHALWAYLLTWLDGKGRRLYAKRLRAYLKSMKTRQKDPVAHFSAHFADGKQGRPADLDAFAVAFGAFFEAFSEPNPPRWTRRYVRASRRRRSKAKMLMDGPTLVRTRERTEPTFGQDHVRHAAHILHQLGEVRAAIGVLEWAWSHDELDQAAADLLVTLCTTLKRPTLIAAARAERQRRSSRAPPKEERGSLQALACSSYEAYVAALRAVAEGLHGLGHNKSAQWFLDEHDVLVAQIGGEPLNLPDLQGVPAAAIPNMGVPVDLGRGGWTEAPLEGYDEFRAPGRWFLTAEQHLVVGLRKEVTARTEYTEDYRTVFVRDNAWHEASYFFEGHIHLITPYVRGAIIVGCRRGDRHLRLEFSAGAEPSRWDPTQKVKKHKAIGVRFEGLRPYDRLVNRTDDSPSGSRNVRLGKQGNDFTIALRVRGPHFECWIDGTHVGSYTDPQGIPADGYIGFATSGGAYRVEEPRLQRLRARNRSSGDLLPEDHDVESPKLPLGPWVLGYRMRGIAPGPEGTVVLWYPCGAEGRTEERASEAAVAAKELWRRVRSGLDNLHHDGRYVVAMPRVWPELSRTLFKGVMDETLDKKAELLLHGEASRPGTPTDLRAWGSEPLVLFIDPLGIVRYIGTGEDAPASETFSAWLRYTRGW